MRILTLCYEYPPLGGGGGRMAKAIAEQLTKRGHDVRVQTAGMRHLPKEEKLGGVQIFRAPSFRRREDRCSVAEMGLYCLTSFRPALRHCRQWRPDVIHAHFAMPTGLLAWAITRRTRIPYVVTAHLGDVPGGTPEQTDRLFRWVGPVAARVWRDAAAATAVSSFVQELAERAYSRRVVRILNGVDLSQGKTPSLEVPKKRRLIFVGRFNPQKCPLFLIDVLGCLAQLDWRLTMVGDGLLFNAARRQARFYGLEDRITFAGWLTNDEVQSALSDADLLLMPSNFEGLPLAAIEALQHGLAIVTSDIPGIRDVVQDEVNGLRLPLGNKEAWIERLRGLLTDEVRLAQMKAASWKNAAAFDLERITRDYEKVLQAAVQPSDPPTTRSQTGQALKGDGRA